MQLPRKSRAGWSKDKDLMFNAMKKNKQTSPGRTLNRQTISSLLFFITIILFSGLTDVLSSPVFASSGGEGESEMVAFFSTGFMWSVINFLIIAFLLYKYAKDPLKEALKKRQETIEKTLDEAAEARMLAEKGLAEARQQLSEKDTVIESILSDAEKAAEREKLALVEQGKRMSRDIVERAKLSMDVELTQAKNELKAEAARLAIELAEKKIRKETSEDDQSRLLENYISMMESRN